MTRCVTRVATSAVAHPNVVRVHGSGRWLYKGVRRVYIAMQLLEGVSLRNYLRTWSPFYHPSKIVVPDAVAGLLARYSAMATSETSEASEVLRPSEA